MSPASLDQERITFVPFDSYLRQTLAGRSGFALEHVPEAEKIFSSDSLYVFPCTAGASAAAE